MEDPVKETVIIVHGTWAGLEPGKNRWYQPVGIIDAAHSFTAKLDAALKERGSPARCWAHCPQSDQIFHWSPGANDWIARTRAAAALADYVAKFQNKGWVCHIIGHSHGGNVVVEAAASNEPLGKLVTLGTPFLDTMSPVEKNVQRLKRVISILSGVSTLSVGLSYCVFDFLNQGRHWQSLFLLYVVLVFAIVLAGLIWFIRRRTRNQVNVFTTPQMQKRLSTFTQTHQFHTPLLAIGSPMDEAWQVLHHLRAIDNPLAIRSGLLKYLFSSLRSQMSRDAEIAHVKGAKSYGDVGRNTKFWLCVLYVFSFIALAIVVFIVKADPNVVGNLFGAARELAEMLSQYPDFAKEFPDASREIAMMFFMFLVVMPLLVLLAVFERANTIGSEFFSAFLSPFRWCFRLLSVLISSFQFATTYFLRGWSWSVLLKIAMGLEGYRFPIPIIEQFPRHIPQTFVKYEDMPQGAQQRAMEKRSAWIARHLGDVSQTFAKMAITAADISALLRTIEQDQSLVHAAYYTDDECIARIADWIAGEE
jgi:hypothetical protein